MSKFEIRATPFGPLIDWRDLAPGADLAIMGITGQGGHIPLSLMLSHQTYVDKARKLAEKLKRDVPLFIAPVRSAEVICFSQDEIDAEVARFVANGALKHLPWGERV